MRNRSLFRTFMIVVGIAATMVIVLSQALPEIQGQGSGSKKVKTEQTDKDTDLKVLSAPSDVVPGGVVQMHDVDRSLLEIFTIKTSEIIEFRYDINILSGFFNILFRAIISPNAP